MFYLYIIIMSLLVVPFAYNLGRRIRFLKLSFFFFRGKKLKSLNIIVTIFAIIAINIFLFKLNEIIVSGSGFHILSKNINYPAVLTIIIIMVFIPGAIGFMDMNRTVGHFRLNDIAGIYIQTNHLAKALDKYISAHFESIYHINEKAREFLRTDEEINDYLKAYGGLKDDLVRIRKIHVNAGDIHGAIKLVDQNIISINNQMGLINYFLGRYDEAMRLYRESYEMYPRALIVDGLMLAFIVLGIAAVSEKLKLNYQRYVSNTLVYLHQINKIDIFNWFMERLGKIRAASN